MAGLQAICFMPSHPHSRVLLLAIPEGVRDSKIDGLEAFTTRASHTADADHVLASGPSCQCALILPLCYIAAVSASASVPHISALRSARVHLHNHFTGCGPVRGFVRGAFVVVLATRLCLTVITSLSFSILTAGGALLLWTALARLPFVAAVLPLHPESRPIKNECNAASWCVSGRRKLHHAHTRLHDRILRESASSVQAHWRTRTSEALDGSSRGDMLLLWIPGADYTACRVQLRCAATRPLRWAELALRLPGGSAMPPAQARQTLKVTSPAVRDLYRLKW